MSIRTKLALTLFVSVAVLLGLNHMMRRESFFTSFASLERTRAAADVERARRAFDDLAERLSTRARRTTTASQSGGGEPAGDQPRGEKTDGGRRDEGDPNALVVHLDLLVDDAGNVLEHRTSDPATDRALVIHEFPSERLSPAHPVLLSWLFEGPPRGVMQTRSGPMILGSAEVTVDGRPHLRVLGLILDDGLLARLRSMSGASFEFAPLSAQNFDDADDASMGIVTTLSGVRLVEEEPGRFAAHAPLRGIHGLPAALVRTPVAQGELDLWNRLERYELLTSIGIALFFPLVLLILIQAVVTGPLSRLTEHASEIGRSDDPSLRLGLERGDEIGVLGREFDHMLEKLERTRIDQQRTARFAGRPEVAVGVVHNVGNLANSLSVAAGIARDRSARADSGDVRAVLDQLVAHRGDLDSYLADDPRGAHLLDFFAALVERMEADSDSARDESSEMLSHVQRITELMRSLESAKAHGGVIERVDLGQQVEAALKLVLSSTGIEVEVVLDTAALPELELDRLRLLEILVAVMTNAVEAMRDLPLAERFLVLCLDQPEPDSVRIEIRDFGVGIEEHLLAKVFAAGFTTKDDDGGFGLHLASLAAGELGGSLRVASDGPGTGATFTLEIPVASARRVNAEADPSLVS